MNSAVFFLVSSTETVKWMLLMFTVGRPTKSSKIISNYFPVFSKVVTFFRKKYLFDFDGLRLKSSCSSWSGSCLVLINCDVQVVDQADGYLPQHLASLRCFLPAAPSSRPNVSLSLSPRVFSGGFSGRAEEEEGSLPPAAVRGLTGLFMSPPPPPNQTSRTIRDFPSSHSPCFG